MSKNLLNSLIVVIIFAVFYIFTKPLYSGGGTIFQVEEGVVSLLDKSKQYDSALKQVDKIIEDSKNLSNQYGSVPLEDKQKIESMLPENIDPIRLVSEINTIANVSGVVLKDLAYNLDKKRQVYVISFTTKTSYSNFKDIMRKYETSLRLLTIKNVKLTAPEKEGENMSFIVKLEAPYVK